MSTFEERARTLVSQMTLDEKISQMMNDAPAIERLGIAAHNWWNECLHGVARAGVATVFPQAIGLAATWNVPLLHQIASVISDEARAKHHEAARNGIFSIYTGLTFWTPNINIFRDPRWGRGQETYGEDPLLTAQLGIAFVKGLQGDDPNHLKVVATPKHFAVHSGPESIRAEFDAYPSERDLWETYLPAFEATVREGGAASVMPAYNRLRGEPCCASPTLLQSILRDRWGFDGYVVSDCGAVYNVWKFHKVAADAAEAAALSVNAGCDLECGSEYRALGEAHARGLIDEATLDRSLVRLFTARFRLGMFDPPEQVGYAQIPYSVNDSEEHRALALRAAQESIVLLKNANHTLPLAKTLARIAVIGPNADNPTVLLGNYNGTPSSSVTPLAGIRAKVSPNTEVVYTSGCGVFLSDPAALDEAVALARDADAVIFVGGLSQALEGEEGQKEGLPEGLISKGDRLTLDLSDAQEQLLRALHATGTPIILVLLNGSAVAINWAHEHLPAIVEAWYPGEEGGTALADVLFGDYNPAGRLPVTFYKSVSDLPPFEDYHMQGRTYRYFTGEPLYPFGHGLSYTRFVYSQLELSSLELSAADSLGVSVTVTNTGERAGDEVVQIYLSAGREGYPLCQLAAFQRIHLAPGQAQTVTFVLTPSHFTRVRDDGQRVHEAGTFTVWSGGGQRDWADGQAATINIIENVC
ncbi:MAG: glycoside hydrolase family 3 C-terminal domain-containing protein [Chloroflexi bacterium]|uniref:glycoside hydrolase family 3 C-terminal domain-containing protein n=1 Tax=Candidatus Flexifilum breve TaxID=3140694 RepID=UPI003136E3AB|nr:glycoside hydrolase family 3 C-terminal domain-containing protein [Chloroflexota bacterium]